MKKARSKLNLLVAKFQEHMTNQGYSLRTIKDYGHVLRYFLDYLEEINVQDITQITRETVYNYQMYLYSLERKGKPLSLETQYTRISPIKSFFRFLLKNNYVLYDPTQTIELPRRKKNLPRDIMTKKEVFKLLSLPDPDTPLGLRDRAIMEVLYSTGIRSAELRALTIYDIDYINGDLRVIKGKNAKDRVIPIGEIACSYVEEYIRTARPKLTQDTSQKILFLTKNGKTINAGNLICMIKKYVKKAKIKKNIAAHSFRHTCATHLLKGKAPLRHIQEILGHYSLETTQIYTKVEVSDLKRAHKLAHPREKWS